MLFRSNPFIPIYQATNCVRSGVAKLLLLAPDSESSEALDGLLDVLLGEAERCEIPVLYCLNRYVCVQNKIVLYYIVLFCIVSYNRHTPLVAQFYLQLKYNCNFIYNNISLLC